MKLIIITICLNSKENLKKTISSLLSQSAHNFEYVIKDGISTDGLDDDIDSYIEKFNNKGITFKYCRKKDTGIYDAMNQALDECENSGFCLFLNAGDTLYSSYVIEEILDLLNNYSYYDVILGHTMLCMRDGRSILDKPFISSEKFNFCHQSTLVKMELLKRLKFDTSYKVAADRDLILKIYSDGGKVKTCNLIISNFYRDGVSTKRYDLLYSEIDKINSKYGLNCRKHNQFVNKLKTVITSVFPALADYVLIHKRLKND